jgi:hypothetical protein
MVSPRIIGLAHASVLAVAKGTCRRFSGLDTPAACQTVSYEALRARVRAARLVSASSTAEGMTTSW